MFAVIKFLIGDRGRRVFVRFPDKNEGCFVPVFCEMAVNAVVTYLEFSADIPFPERGVAGVDRGVPVVVPAQEVAIFAEPLGKTLFPYPFVHLTSAKLLLPSH